MSRPKFSWMEHSGDQWGRLKPGYVLENGFIGPPANVQDEALRYVRHADGRCRDDADVLQLLHSVVERYDPLEGYMVRDRGDRPPHLALLDLDPTDEEAVLNFVDEWGILGLLQHNLIRCTYVEDVNGWAYPKHQPPRALSREAVQDSWCAKIFGSNPDGIVAVEETPTARYEEITPILDAIDFWAWEEIRDLRGFERGEVLRAAGMQKTEDGQWEDPGTGGEVFESPTEAMRANAVYEYIHGNLIPGWIREDELAIRQWKEDRQRTGEVLHRSTEDSIRKRPVQQLSRSNLEEYFSRHYPQLPGESYPGLHDPTRWLFLSEPMSGFRKAVSEFQLVFKLCRTDSDSDAPSDVNGMNRKHQFGRELLLEHLRAVCPAPRRDAKEDRWEWGWSLPSLLSGCYLLLYFDLVEGRKFLECANETCGRTFTPSRSDQKHCCDACARAQAQREYRRRKKEDQDS